jgi:hypothetical protein
MEKNDQFLRVQLTVLILLLNTLVFTQVNVKKLNRSLSKSSISTHSKEKLVGDFLWKYPSDTFTQTLAISFRNNPFQFDAQCEVLIVFGNCIIAEGNFSLNSLQAKVPLALIGEKSSPKIVVRFEGKNYLFSCDQSLKTITEKDHLIHLVFMPENEYETIYFVSTNYEINEN